MGWWHRNWAEFAGITAIVLSVLAVAGVVFIALPAYQRTEDAARSGARAQMRLVKIAPITCLNYRDQVARGVISGAQFRFATSRRAGFAGDCSLSPLPDRP